MWPRSNPSGWRRYAYLWAVPNGGHKPDLVFADTHAGAFAKTALEFLNGDWREVVL